MSDKYAPPQFRRQCTYTADVTACYPSHNTIRILIMNHTAEGQSNHGSCPFITAQKRFIAIKCSHCPNPNLPVFTLLAPSRRCLKPLDLFATKHQGFPFCALCTHCLPSIDLYRGFLSLSVSLGLYSRCRHGAFNSPLYVRRALGITRHKLNALLPAAQLLKLRFFATIIKLFCNNRHLPANPRKRVFFVLSALFGPRDIYPRACSSRQLQANTGKAREYNPEYRELKPIKV